jgi:hypothetical protein
MWAGVDSAWEQEKPEARKMFGNGNESHLSTILLSQFHTLICDLSRLHIPQGQQGHSTCPRSLIGLHPTFTRTCGARYTEDTIRTMRHSAIMYSATSLAFRTFACVVGDYSTCSATPTGLAEYTTRIMRHRTPVNLATSVTLVTCLSHFFFPYVSQNYLVIKNIIQVFLS